jgi:hypothetical protein
MHFLSPYLYLFATGCDKISQQADHIDLDVSLEKILFADPFEGRVL